MNKDTVVIEEVKNLKQEAKMSNHEPGKTVVAQEGAVMTPPVAMTDAPVTPEKPSTDGLVEVVHWEKPKEFLSYIEVALKRIPPYKRTNAASIERALAYYDHLLSEISKVLRVDLEGELSVEDLDKLEELRGFIMTQEQQLETILKPLERAWKKKGSTEGEVKTAEDCKPEDCVDCPNCGEKMHKHQHGNKCPKCNAPIVASTSDTMVKEATTPKMVYVRDPFIDNIARDLINAKVSSGKNLEAAFDHVVKQMKLSLREQYQLEQHLKDSGYPIRRNIFNEFGPTNYYA